MRMVKHWNSLKRSEIFKTLNNLEQPDFTLKTALGEGDLINFQIPLPIQ